MDQLLEIYYNLYATSLDFALPHTHILESPGERPKDGDYSQLVESQQSHQPTPLLFCHLMQQPQSNAQGKEIKHEGGHLIKSFEERSEIPEDLGAQPNSWTKLVRMTGRQPQPPPQVYSDEVNYLLHRHCQNHPRKKEEDKSYLQNMERVNICVHKHCSLPSALQVCFYDFSGSHNFLGG